MRAGSESGSPARGHAGEGVQPLHQQLEDQHAQGEGVVLRPRSQLGEAASWSSGGVYSGLPTRQRKTCRGPAPGTSPRPPGSPGPGADQDVRLVQVADDVAAPVQSRRRRRRGCGPRAAGSRSGTAGLRSRVRGCRTRTTRRALLDPRHEVADHGPPVGGAEQATDRPGDVTGARWPAATSAGGAAIMAAQLGGVHRWSGPVIHLGHEARAGRAARRRPPRRPGRRRVGEGEILAGVFPQHAHELDGPWPDPRSHRANTGPAIGPPVFLLSSGTGSPERLARFVDRANFGLAPATAWPLFAPCPAADGSRLVVLCHPWVGRGGGSGPASQWEPFAPGRGGRLPDAPFRLAVLPPRRSPSGPAGGWCARRHQQGEGSVDRVALDSVPTCHPGTGY